jgi:hypothetical protein
MILSIGRTATLQSADTRPNASGFRSKVLSDLASLAILLVVGGNPSKE